MTSTRIHSRLCCLVLISLFLGLGWIPGRAGELTLETLRRQSKLTPQKFAKHFADFKYVRHAAVQPFEVFLATRAGDCDDYAILAAQLLAEKGYTTRLVAVRMPADVHVVCYVAEAKCYLDFNNRQFLVRTAGSDGSLRDIADKVSRSFNSRWSSVSEFAFRNGAKILGPTLLKTSPMLAQIR